MKLSKPEDMDEIEEQPVEQIEDGAAGEIEGDSPQAVSVFGDEIEMSEAVRLIAEMVEQPEHFGIATESDVRELREAVESQRKAIAELAEAVEILGKNQGEIASGDPDSSPTVRLEPDQLNGIYDPTEEFENGN